jgi:DNA-binding NtrC family response regulator
MILIVEDDAIVRNSLALLLRTHGHEVMEARDGTEAVTLLNNRDFGLVITDLVMPKTNGFHLVDQIRSKWPQTPILLISGYVSQDAGKIILGDVAEFMHKPIDSPALIATVQRLLIPISAR